MCMIVEGRDETKQYIDTDQHDKEKVFRDMIGKQMNGGAE